METAREVKKASDKAREKHGYSPLHLEASPGGVLTDAYGAFSIDEVTVIVKLLDVASTGLTGGDVKILLRHKSELLKCLEVGSSVTCKVPNSPVNPRLVHSHNESRKVRFSCDETTGDGPDTTTACESIGGSHPGEC